LTSSLLDAPVAVTGVQTPRLLWTPPAPVSSAGQEAVDLAASVGLHLDPWQSLVLDHALAEDDAGKWSSFEVGLDVARQNGKSAVLEARILAGLFLFDEALIVYSAHLFDTSVEVMRRLCGWIDGTDWMRRRVKLTRAGEVGKWSHGEEGVELLSGHRVRFKTRTKGGGRGLSGDCVILDEAMYLSDAHISALMPLMAARSVTGSPQIWYAGSAGEAESVVFGRVRDRAMAGGDPSMTWLEWSVDERAYAEALSHGEAAGRAFAKTPINIATANPGLGIRISLKHCLHEERAMHPPEYARERLGVGQWPRAAGSDGPISPDQWASVADGSSECADPVVFAIAVSLDGAHAAVGVAGARDDGLAHVEVVEHASGTHWVAARALELRDKHTGSLVLLDGGSRANQLVPALIEAGFGVHSGQDAPAPGSLVIVGREVTAAFGAFVSAVTESPTALRHRPHPALDTAIGVATARSVGQALAWDGKNLADISALQAVTLAAYGHAKYGQRDYDVLNSVW